MPSRQSIFLVNYASESFLQAARLQSLLFLINGGSGCINFTPEDIPKDFREENLESLTNPRGSGLWLWKPKILSMALDLLPEESVVLYLDSGVVPTQHFHELFEQPHDGITLWRVSDSNCTVEQWTHPTVIEAIDPTTPPQFPLLWSGAILVKNEPSNRQMINRWLKLCCNQALLNPMGKREGSMETDNNFIAHRHDQSILTVLAAKNNELIRVKSASLFERYFYLRRKPDPTFLLIYLPAKFSIFFRDAIRIVLPSRIHLQLQRWKFSFFARKKGYSDFEIKRTLSRHFSRSGKNH